MQLTRMRSSSVFDGSAFSEIDDRRFSRAIGAQTSGPPFKPATDEVEIIEPPPALRIGPTECLMPRKTARVRTWKVVRKILDRNFFQVASGTADACVIVSDVEAAIFMHGAIDQGLDIGLAADVGALIDGGSPPAAAISEITESTPVS